ncbi:uncharacterized protein LOC128329530 [Hemicordylus capensis]|uniref:uncharacterized protein LOC128329530 n=1 Tax=Hemicordylus capensis TaxID=884348 RepID=UPI0023049919|nr:uncharacterized protein LOC128329530 [Hemicordylus capensis]XP_053116888.1 uncharacterized protein LOC128329530 [Hemicordylus capensis]XP_053116889.1 uncharacterized protein LOC128329530 [Hemicordylus capensis]
MSQIDAAIEIPALGRPFQLGMLYDCRNDTLVPGITLWDLELLQKDLCVKPQPKTESEIIASDSIDDKASALNIKASLKASFLVGLVELEGSAKYLNDTKKSQRQARVTLQYKVTTKFEQLTMSHLGTQNVSYRAVFDQGTATHVVTAILHGAQAFFVFDREVSSSENILEIQGNLQAVIKNTVSITGQAELEINKKGKSHAENFSCKFHGDFSLDKNPVTFQDAMEVYTALPKMLGQDGEKAVPVTVWLYPLTKLDSRAAKLVREIRLALLFDAQSFMEQLTEINMRCNDLAKNPITDTFPEIKRKIQQFSNLCKKQKQIFQKELAGILPSIRGGGKEEVALVDILTAINQSPFNSQRLTEFLDTKEREMNFVSSYLSILKGIDIISSQNKLEKIVLNPEIQFVVSFTFTSFHEKEPFLSSLQDCLQKQHIEKTASPCSVPEKCMAWFEDNERHQCARRSAKAISNFARINKSNQKIQYIVASVPDEDNPGASIYLYEEGDLVSRSFELPFRPLPPLIGEVGHDCVQLIFQPADYGRANISSYQVEYRIAGEEDWTTLETEDSQETFPVMNLHLNTKYQFQYTAKSKLGLSETSNTSKLVKTLPTSPPGKPKMVLVESSRISVAWDGPKVTGVGVLIQEYKVEYREVEGEESPEGKDPWAEQRTGGKTEFFHIERLKPQTAYRFRVSAVCADEAMSAPSEEVEIATSQEEEEGSQRIAQKYLQENKLTKRGEPSVYALPFKNASPAVSKAGVTYYLGRKTWKVPNKVIMVMGATGSGKTTLINGMINYVLGVQWGDNFRFELIHDITKRSQAESQTPEVTAYVVNHQKGFQVPYSLTIIDTPGFGDTRGIEYDKLITQQIREFFSTPRGTNHIDAICFVVQASLPRLTHAQKYVFDSVLSIFGKEIKDNIQVLVTYADGQTPPVLEAIKAADVPCAKDAKGTPVHFQFNNSILFAKNTVAGKGTGNLESQIWNLSFDNMKTFLGSLNALETKSLTLTRVSQERKELDTLMVGLQPQIDTGLVKMEELKKMLQTLDQHKDDMKANRDFEYEVPKTVRVKADVCETGNYATNCRNCSYTCHYPCTVAKFGLKCFCDAIRFFEGTCRVCPGQCASSVHISEQCKFEYKTVKEKMTYEDLKQKYQHASEEVMTTEEVLENLLQEYEEVKDVLADLLRRASKCRQRLWEIALKPNLLSTPEYIDLLIESEKQELKPGYQERIQSLMEVRKVAEMI